MTRSFGPIWVTEDALEKGIVRIDEFGVRYLRDKWLDSTLITQSHGILFPGQWFDSLADAQDRAEQMRSREIAEHEKEIARLRALDFSQHEPQ